ncbi:MAG TPA: methyltransferase domain-containing protein [Vicinamibacterales bacterium]|jgi:SAM-dependent methyltransferase|nr:methyltransferase domain-containing protein [Vicinamibacterales bacterium]
MTETQPPREIVEYYDRYAEESRLQQGASRLELERTQDILSRVLPPPPARVVDVGGAAGVYSAWLAARSYDVRLLDASPRLVAEARRLNATLPSPIATIDVGDARRLPYDDASADAVLVMGPLYHLPSSGDRAGALSEAKRVLVPGGVVAVAAISRFASALDGLARGLAADPEFVRMRDRDLVNGQHRNDTARVDYFTTAYFHQPGELHDELVHAGFRDVRVLGVEGPAWMVPDFDARWADPVLRGDMMAMGRALEAEPTVLGVSAHLLAIGTVAP